jgi:UDP-2,3-diacylglucosamine hydrolase
MQFIELKPHQKIYFASDFHLGVPTLEKSQERERKIIRWLDAIKADAQVIFLMGDIFDFWFEYKHAIPKGMIRFQGKLAELVDSGIQVVFFTGNHDMWLFDYFTKELGIPIYRKPLDFVIGNQTFYLGHGDGLGPGDRKYKILKKIFANPICQWLFGGLHPNIGIGIAKYWSRHSRIQSTKKGEEHFLGEAEWLWTYTKEQEQKKHRDYYIFGHRHLPLDLKVGEKARYVNLGEWLHHCTYAVYDGKGLVLKTFEDTTNAPS